MGQLWNGLGPTWSRLLIGVFAIALGGSLALAAAFGPKPWVISAQLGLAWLFLFATVWALHSRTLPKDRQRLWLALGPGLALLAIGVIWPGGVLFLAGAGVGWIVVAQFVLRSRVRMEYQAAVKHLRRSAYDEAATVMDGLIQADPDDLGHRRFRAEIYRLAGRLDRAIKDYEELVARDPESPIGLAGLAETYAQSGDYATALTYARRARACDPQQWMGAYNLGMIEDRLGMVEDAVEHLQQALSLNLSGSRYHLLASLWLARNYYRLGWLDEARAQLDVLRQHTSGLRDWQIVFESEQAAALRGMFETDVHLAQDFVDGEVRLDRLEQVEGSGKLGGQYTTG